MKRLLFILHAMCMVSVLPAQVAPQAKTSNLNVGFIQNAGQIYDQHGIPNKKVRYLSSSGDFHLALNNNGFSYELLSFESQQSPFSESGSQEIDDQEDGNIINDQIEVTSSRIDVTLLGANPKPELIAGGQLPGTLNFYNGSGSGSVVLNVPRYQKITYKNIYKGIDLEFAYRQEFRYSPLEYRFIIHPGADASQIRMKYQGARFMTVNANGDLTIGSTIGEIAERGLYSFEEKTNLPVACHYKLLNNQTVGFDIASSSDNTIIIDPEIVWGTYYGGKGSENWDTESEIRVDHLGYVLLCGSTQSTSKISTLGVAQEKYASNRDMFLAKFSPDGKTLVFGTYYGGDKKDAAYAIDVDINNNIYLGGLTLSDGLSKTPCFKATKSGKSDALIAKFNTLNGQLFWATYFGGPADGESEHVRCIQVMPGGEFYVCGFITSDGIGTPGVYQGIYSGEGDAFLARFNVSGLLDWATYYGGDGVDRAHTLRVAGDFVYITGTASSKTGMATLGAFQEKLKGGSDSYLAKFLAADGTLDWATYYGGILVEHGRGVVVDHQGNIYINGWATSEGLATVGSHMPVKDPTPSGATLNEDGYLAKFSPAGNRIWATYYGGNKTDWLFNLILDEQDNLYFCGKTSSVSNISTPGALQVKKNGGLDGYIGKMDIDGNLIWCTYFGSDATDEIYSLDVDPAGSIYFNVCTNDTLATTPGVYQETLAGITDIAIFKILPDAGCTDKFESNETIANAASIVASNNPACYGFKAAIAAPADEDWYKVTLSTDPNLKVTLLDLQAAMNIELYNSNGMLLTQTTSPGLENKSLLYNSTVGATYTIHIVHDASITEGSGCYRLQVLKSKTPIVLKMNDEATLTNGPLAVEVFPNPAVSDVTIRIYAEADGILQNLITDQMGRIAISSTQQVSAGNNEWKLDVSKLPAGIYQLTCTDQHTTNSQLLVIVK